MKKSDIAMIVLIASLGIVVAYFVASSIPFLRVPSSGVEVQTIPKISSDIEQPDKTVFHRDAINPTVEAIVGNATGN